jgi:hypothetical protein
MIVNEDEINVKSLVTKEKQSFIFIHRLNRENK